MFFDSVENLLTSRLLLIVNVVEPSLGEIANCCCEVIRNELDVVAVFGCVATSRFGSLSIVVSTSSQIVHDLWLFVKHYLHVSHVNHKIFERQVRSVKRVFLPKFKVLSNGNILQRVRRRFDRLIVLLQDFVGPSQNRLLLITLIHRCLQILFTFFRLFVFHLLVRIFLVLR